MFEAALAHVLDIASVRCMAGATPNQDWGSFMTTMDEDRDHLNAMGYAQELHRGMSTFSNFAISFSIISILAGGMTSFWLGMATGGPRVIIIGWVVVGFFVLLVGMAMGEICSAYPDRRRVVLLVGQAGPQERGALVVVHRVLQPARPDRRHRLGRLRLSIFIAYFIRMFDDGFKLTVGSIYIIFLIVLVVHGLLNTFRIDLVKIMGDISVWWHVVGVVIIAAVLFIAPSNRRGIGGAFDTAPPGLTGWNGGMFITIYLFALGLLLAQYTITGFDASAHVSEETKVRAPRHRRRSCARSTSRPLPRSC